MDNGATQRKVSVIKPTIQIPSLAESLRPRLLNVCGYARVSTDSEEQLNSYEAQVAYYTEYIKARSDWNYIDVFTDEGVSATSTKRRKGFTEMINRALNGEIDMIITKSLSRFARNTVDTLLTIRKLKEKGVAVFFENQNINTLDANGELLITILSSLAQEESRNISENVKWGKRKAFADGKISIPYKRFLGYQKGPDGLPEIVEEEAEIVRWIYRMFIYGKTAYTIAQTLMEQGHLTPSGKELWRPGLIFSILTNEKYKGEAILQKKFTVDFLTKEQRVNTGEVPQYHVKNSHPAIIDPDIWAYVQYEMQRRREVGISRSSTHCFSGKILCGECGAAFGSRSWNAGTQYQALKWQCRNEQCPHPGPPLTLSDYEIKAAFVEAFNALVDGREEIISAYEELAGLLSNTEQIDKELHEAEQECVVVAEMMQRAIAENASKPQDQTEYARRFTELSNRLELAKQVVAEKESQRMERLGKKAGMTLFIRAVKGLDGYAAEFDEEKWYTTTDHVSVFADGTMEFVFRDGSSHTVINRRLRRKAGA